MIICGPLLDTSFVWSWFDDAPRKTFLLVSAKHTKSATKYASFAATYPKQFPDLPSSFTLHLKLVDTTLVGSHDDVVCS